MKILVLDEEFPWPLDTGKRIRSFNLIQRLAARHQVRYLAYGKPATKSYNYLEKSGITPIAVPPQVPRKSGPLFYLRLLMNLFSPQPYIVTSHYSGLFADALRREIAALRPDLILCEWSPYAVFVRDITGPKKLIVAHNIEHVIWQRYYDNEANPAKRWYIGVQMKKLERFERNAFTWADGATAVSDKEARLIEAFAPNARVTVIDNGVDLDYFVPGPAPPDPPRLVFVGSLDWRPNQDAVQYYVDDILPALDKLGVRATIDIVGRNPSADLTALADHPSVNITGRVDDVRPYVERAAVYVVPLRIGGGTRLKILEALAMKKAVVATSVGAEGLKVTDGENIMLADTPESFAKRISQLLEDRNLNRQLGEAGRTLVEKRYGWDYLAAKLEKTVLELVAED
jgi:sugar transferase (PEP-CTERM/EpsH1 system associated)